MTQENVAKVDGDRLAEAIRRVSPFIAGKTVQQSLQTIFFESHEGTLELTTTDGYRMAHLTLPDMGLPEGDYILGGDGCKDFAFRHYGGGEVQVELLEMAVKLGDMVVARVEGPWVDYRRVKPDSFDVLAIVETKKWIRPVRQQRAEVVGVVYSEQGCRMYFQTKGETVASEPAPVQMFSGPERKIAYPGESLRRALTSCGASATIKVGDPQKPTLFEADNYWHLLTPMSLFPREVNLTPTEREALKWAQEALESIRKGEVAARVMVGGGKFYLELGEGITETEILAREPILVRETHGMA